MSGKVSYEMYEGFSNSKSNIIILSSIRIGVQLYFFLSRFSSDDGINFVKMLFVI